jgi:hypothetical protein
VEDVGTFIKHRFSPSTAELPTSPIVLCRRPRGAVIQYAPVSWSIQTTTTEPPPWSFVLQLIHILPSKSSEKYEWHERLSEIARRLFPEDVRPMKLTILDEDLPAAWEKPISICIDRSIAKLVQIGSIQAFQQYYHDPILWLNQFYKFMEKRPDIQAFEDAAIIPDQHGKFKKRKDLFADEIPDVFKTAAFEAQGLELRSVMLHPGITAINLERKQTLRDIGAFIEKQYSQSSEQRRYLIRILEKPFLSDRHKLHGNSH